MWMQRYFQWATQVGTTGFDGTLNPAFGGLEAMAPMQSNARSTDDRVRDFSRNFILPTIELKDCSLVGDPGVVKLAAEQAFFRNVQNHVRTRYFVRPSHEYGEINRDRQRNLTSPAI